MNSKTSFAIAAIAVVAALLVTTSAMSPSNVQATYKKTQALSQVNSCGNGPLPRDVDCQNAASQIQGKHNSAAVAASQGADSGSDHGSDHGRDNGGDNGRDNGGGDNGRGDNGGSMG